MTLDKGKFQIFYAMSLVKWLFFFNLPNLFLSLSFFYSNLPKRGYHAAPCLHTALLLGLLFFLSLTLFFFPFVISMNLLNQGSVTKVELSIFGACRYSRGSAVMELSCLSTCVLLINLWDCEAGATSLSSFVSWVSSTIAIIEWALNECLIH